jgi:hypothetical protein
MAEPINEQIARTLLARMVKVTTSNGYHQTAEVERPAGTPGSIKPRDLLAVLLQQDPDEDEENSVPGNPLATAWTLPFEVSLFIRPSEDDTLPLDTRINRFVADMVKAIATDPSVNEPWHTFGGLAYNARIRPWQLFAASDGTCEGATFVVEVSYRTPENDPYTCR